MDQITTETSVKGTAWERDRPGGSAATSTSEGKPDGMSDVEWSLRQRLAAAYRIVDHLAGRWSCSTTSPCDCRGRNITS